MAGVYYTIEDWRGATFAGLTAGDSSALPDPAANSPNWMPREDGKPAHVIGGEDQYHRAFPRFFEKRPDTTGPPTRLRLPHLRHMLASARIAEYRYRGHNEGDPLEFENGPAGPTFVPRKPDTYGLDTEEEEEFEKLRERRERYCYSGSSIGEVSWHHNAFMVTNLVTPREAAALIRKAEGLVEDVTAQYAQRDRECSRTLVRAPELARELFARLVPHLKPSDYEGHVPLCFGQGGVWRPVAVNDVIKIVKYEPEAGHFVTHRDGPWLPREDQASLYTVIVYLNEDFGAGETLLHGEVGMGMFAHMGRVAPAAVAPVTGAALLFNHDMVHAGNVPRFRPKWILRTELIFERVAAAPELLVDRYCHLSASAFVTMKRRYDEAHQRCDDGDRAGFMAEYQQVVVEQQAASLADAAALVGAMRRSPKCPLLPATTTPGDDSDVDEGVQKTPRLNRDALASVLLFLPDKTLVDVMCLARAFYFEVAASPMWRERALERFGSALPASLRAAMAPEVAAAVPWLVVYRQQKAWARRFAPAILWPLTCGAVLTTPECIPDNLYFHRASDRLYGVAPRGPLVEFRGTHKPGRLTPKLRVLETAGRGWDQDAEAKPTATAAELAAAVCAAHDQDGGLRTGCERPGPAGTTVLHHRLPDVYGELHYAFPLHVNFPDSERYGLAYRDPMPAEKWADARSPHVQPARPVVDGAGDVEVSVLLGALDEAYDTPWAPVALVDHPRWCVPASPGSPPPDAATLAATRHRHVRQLFEVLRAPAVCVLTIAECLIAKTALERNCAATEVSAHFVLGFTASVDAAFPAGAINRRDESWGPEVTKRAYFSADANDVWFAHCVVRHGIAGPWQLLKPAADDGGLSGAIVASDTPKTVVFVPAFHSLPGVKERWRAALAAACDAAAARLIVGGRSFVNEGAMVVASAPDFRSRCAFRLQNPALVAAGDGNATDAPFPVPTFR